jgi:hypothetical protein
MPQLYTGMQSVTAKTMRPITHLRGIHPEMKEGVSRFTQVYCYVISSFIVLFNHGANRTQVKILLFVLR